MVTYRYISKNGEVLPFDKAHVPVANVEYSYGFGVYETIRVRNGKPLFLDDHLERLELSASIIGLEHNFPASFIEQAIEKLLTVNDVATCNLKILLIGAKLPQDAQLYILCLPPLFPDRKLYKTGARVISYEHERLYPHAKTLNMLPSYLAYKKATEAGAYDALLVDRGGHYTEGTRTNLFFLKGNRLVSPPEEKILLGVTRLHVLEVAQKINLDITHQDVTLADLLSADSVFITSTSTKIMPIRAIDNHELPSPTDKLRELMKAFDDFTHTFD